MQVEVQLQIHQFDGCLIVSGNKFEALFQGSGIKFEAFIFRALHIFSVIFPPKLEVIPNFFE